LGWSFCHEEKIMKTKFVLSAALLGAASLLVGMEVGKICFTKQASTALLAEASRNAASVGSVEWGKPLKVLAVTGRWLSVSSGDLQGWIYSGNVSSEKPPIENKNDLLPTTAADTSAAVAARPLSNSSRRYAERKSLSQAAADIEWVEQQADRLTRTELESYLQEKNLGDYAQ
jgi:hypothetical protein